MADYGIKITESGKSVSSNDVRDYTMHSSYWMLKYHSDSTSGLTISAGDTSGTVDFSHTLGYVPMFIAYVEFDWYSSYQYILPFGVSPQPMIVSAFATDSEVTCRVNMLMYEEDKDFTFRVIIFKDKIA